MKLYNITITRRTRVIPSGDHAVARQPHRGKGLPPWSESEPGRVVGQVDRQRD